MTDTRKKFKIGEMTVDPVHNEILKIGSARTVEQKAMDVLLYLAEHNGRTVSREELLDAVWSDTYVTEESLTRCISILRKAFDDDPGKPAYIKTIRNKGYRLIAKVSEPGQPDSDQELWTRISNRRWFRIAGVVAVLMFLGLLPAVLVDNADVATSPVLWTKEPLTTRKGVETEPSLSPGGSRIAYSVRDMTTGRWSIYVHVTGAGDPYPLTGGDFDDRAPEWSPDGRFIAFIRRKDTGSTICYTPAMGGSVNKIIDRNIGDFQHLSWSPDGSWIAYSDRPSPEASMTLFRVNIRTGEAEQLTQTSAQHWGDFSPSYSPDGRKISFISSVSAGTQAIYQLDLEKGKETRLTPGFLKTKYLEWSGSDSTIYYSTDLPAPNSIWEITETAPFESRWTGMSGSSFSAGPHRSVAATQEGGDSDLWSWTPERGGLAVITEPDLNSAEGEYSPVPSPGGRYLAFISERTGHPELWIYDYQRAATRQLTRYEGKTELRSPAWHPSGERIVFNVFDPVTHADIHTVEISGAPARPLVAGRGNEVNPAWRPNGESLLFGSDRSGVWQIWSYSPSTEAMHQITTQGGYTARPVPEGEGFYFTKYGRSGLWEYLENGTENRVLSTTPKFWDIGRDGIYLVSSDPSSTAAVLQLYDFKKRSLENVTPLNEFRNILGMAYLPEGKGFIISGARMPESGIYLYTLQDSP